MYTLILLKYSITVYLNVFNQYKYTEKLLINGINVYLIKPRGIELTECAQSPNICKKIIKIIHHNKSSPHQHEQH